MYIPSEEEVGVVAFMGLSNNCKTSTPAIEAGYDEFDFARASIMILFEIGPIGMDVLVWYSIPRYRLMFA